MFQSAATLPVGPTPAYGGTRAPAAAAAVGTASRLERVLADYTASSASLLSKSVSLEMLAARCRAAVAAVEDRIQGHAAQQWLRAASMADAAVADRLRWRGGSRPPTSASVAAISGAGKTAGR